jgi:hypothetical protein
MVEKKSKFTFTVNVRLEQAEEKELPKVMVYAFDATGQFLAAKALPKGEQGQVKLELPSELADTTVRVVLGPQQAEERQEVPMWMDKLIRRGEVRKETPSLASLSRKGAYEKRVRLAADGGIIDMVVFQPDWTKWLLCRCVVRGRLVKRVPLPDGTTKELGVCHACVKMYEVDKIPKIILQLPERDLFRLRDELWRILEKPLPRPVVFPPPPPPPPETIGKVVGPMTIAGPERTPLLGSLVATPVIPLPPPEPTSSLKGELEPIFRAASVSQLRSALVAKAEVLAVHICSLEWLWYWFHTDLIKCVCTDEQGRFETTIWYRCAGDKPDLYFKAVQCIGGTLHTLYDPGVACHTYWDYVCGSEVVLETDDPAAITCVSQDPVDPPPGVSLWVMPYGVGGIRLDQIYPKWQKDPIGPGWHMINPIPEKYGLTDFADGVDTWVDVPFGSTLGFRHGYSSGIPYDVPDKPAYYRWLYNKLDSVGNETEWREFAAPVAETVVRHYVDYDLAHPELPPTFPAYLLGPQEKNNMHLYEFKPHKLLQVSGHKREWPVDDWFAEIYSGIIQSVNLPGGVASAAGKYKIKLEVYDKNANMVSPGPGTFNFIVPTGLAADGVTILTRKAEASEIQGGGFIFYLHVDNNQCEAEIYDTIVNGVAAGPCGFIGYAPGDDVHLSFKAKHPNGFGRFKFTIVRGSSGYVLAASAPADPSASPPIKPDDVAWPNAPLVTDTPVNGFKRNASSVFTKNVGEAAMRGGCPKAAFSENLYVAATATNGWGRLSGLDASALPKAFALEPKTT